MILVRQARGLRKNPHGDGYDYVGQGVIAGGGDHRQVEGRKCRGRVSRRGYGDWETVTAPVSQRLAGWLDLTTVNTGLLLFPSAPQTGGITFQVDNVSWG